MPPDGLFGGLPRRRNRSRSPARRQLVKGGGSQEWRLFLITGVLGGFTTFSAFSLDAALMWQRSEYVSLGSYVSASVILSIAGLFSGMAAARAIT